MNNPVEPDFDHEADEVMDTFAELVRQRDELRAENERLRADNAELSAECDQWGEKVAECWREIERLTASHDAQVRESERYSQRLFDERQVNKRLRSAAQAVIDSINDENEIDPDVIFRLSETLDRDDGG